MLPSNASWCWQRPWQKGKREWLTEYKHILRLPTLTGGSDNIGFFLIMTVTFHSLAPPLGSSAWGIDLRVTLQQDIIPTPFSFGKVVCIFTCKDWIWFGSARIWLAYPFGSLAPWFKVLISLCRQEGLFFFFFFLKVESSSVFRQISPCQVNKPQKPISDSTKRIQTWSSYFRISVHHHTFIFSPGFL